MSPIPSSFSLLVVCDGQTSTLSILERGLKFQEKTTGIGYRIVELTEGIDLTVQQNEIVLFVRSSTPLSAGLAHQLQSNNRPYLYYIDDDFWSLSLKSSFGAYYRSPSTLAAMHELISRAAIVITNSDVLAKQLSKKSKSVRVVPAFFDFELLQQGVQHESKQLEKKPPIRIGFASNHSRAQDFSMLIPAIQRLLKEYNQLEVEVIGFAPIGIKDMERVTTFQHLNKYEEYVAFQLSRQWTVGLAPLRNTSQNRAKTNNKYREYAAMGIAGVYSDLPPYAEVQNARTGFRVNASPNSWFQAISKLINDADLHDCVVENAKADVHEKYGIEVFTTAWTPLFRYAAVEGNHGSTLIWRPAPANLKLRSSYRLWYAFQTETPTEAIRHTMRFLARKIQRFWSKNPSRL